MIYHYLFSLVINTLLVNILIYGALVLSFSWSLITLGPGINYSLYGNYENKTHCAF